MDTKNLLTWIEISDFAYSQNLKFFKEQISKNTELSLVIKSNAYGHGIKNITELAQKYGVNSFCVHSLEEGIVLRNIGVQGNILIMGPVLTSKLPEAIQENFRIVIYNTETLRELIKITDGMKKKTKIHLKLETGTYRQGILEKDLRTFLEILKNVNAVELEGAYTHFANIEDTTNHEYAYLQLNIFKRMVKQIKEAGFPETKVHAACSAAILLFPETHFDMVRLGISQYGLWPSRETLVSYKAKHAQYREDILKPILQWKTRIGQIKQVDSRQTIGYGLTFQTTRKSKIAVLPIGYADGYDRELSNQGYVLIHGHRAPIRGRVCMNLIMVDVTDIPNVRLEDEVVLLGIQGGEKITVEDLARICGTINYEFITRISWEIPRIVVK
jgi:alanine racemase